MTEAQQETNAEPFEGVAEALQESQEPTEPNKSEGKEPVDFATASPEEIQARFDYLYKQVKDNKRTKAEIRELRDIAAQQSEVINQLTSGFSGMAETLQTEKFQETEARLNQEIATAYENGDMQKYHAAQGKLTDLLLEKKLAEKEAKNKPAEKTELPRNAGQAAQQAYSDNEISYEDQQFINEWQAEKDENGNLLRPWAYNSEYDPNQPDRISPENRAAWAELYAISNSPRFRDASWPQKMAELDRRMGVKSRSNGQTVMGGTLTRPAKQSKVSLSPEQEMIAKRLKVGGPKASDADHIKAYKQQLEALKGAR